MRKMLNCFENNTPDVFSRELRLGYNVNGQGKDYKTLLIKIIEAKGFPEGYKLDYVAQILYNYQPKNSDYYIDLNIRDYKGRSAIYSAIENGYTTIVDTLIFYAKNHPESPLDIHNTSPSGYHHTYTALEYAKKINKAKPSKESQIIVNKLEEYNNFRQPICQSEPKKTSGSDMKPDLILGFR